MDAHQEALIELRRLFDMDSASSGARAAFRALEIQKPFKLWVACVDAATAIWTEDAVTATKLFADASDLLLEIVAAARAADWERIVVLVQGAIPLVDA